MEIQKIQNNDQLTIKITGRIDTTGVPQLAKDISLDGIKNLILDLEKVDYISSAGLGALILFQKKMENQGGHLTLCHISSDIREIFKMVGFIGLFDIQ